jgi:hypothetical protein
MTGKRLSFKAVIDRGLAPDPRLERRHIHAISLFLRLRYGWPGSADKWMSERRLMPIIRNSLRNDDAFPDAPTAEDIRAVLDDLVSFSHVETEVRSYPDRPDVIFYRLNAYVYI